MRLGPPDPRLAPGQAHPPAPSLAAAATIAGVATFACLVLRGTSHFLSMNAFEPLLILALVHVLVRLAQGEDPRLWVAAGGLAGLAVLFKYSSAPLALALLLGFLATPARRALRTPWALAGAAFGILVVLPNFAWQASHGFPFLELVHDQLAYKNTPTTPLQFLGGVLFEANPGNAPIWLGGLAWLLLARSARAARFAGVGGLIYLLLLTFGHAKPYYLSPLLPVLLGAGGAAFAAVIRSRRTQRIWCGALAASALIFSPMAVPILPVEAFVAYQAALGMRTSQMERLSQSVLPQVVRRPVRLARAGGGRGARLPRASRRGPRPRGGRRQELRRRLGGRDPGARARPAPRPGRVRPQPVLVLGRPSRAG